MACVFFASFFLFLSMSSCTSDTPDAPEYRWANSSYMQLRLVYLVYLVHFLVHFVFAHIYVSEKPACDSRDLIYSVYEVVRKLASVMNVNVCDRLAAE